jgi:hypothetical protein
MCKGLEEKMANRSDEIFAMMRADYMQVLGGVQVSKDAMPRDEQSMRTEVKAILDGVGAQFERIVNGELNEEEQESDWVHVEQSDADNALRFEDENADSVLGSTGDPEKDESMLDAVDDTVITEPSPGKSSDVNRHNVTMEEVSDEEL